MARKTMKPKYFALVVGSGFSGSLLAWILQKQGKDTLLIDQSAHPRFAIGESSTPTADFLIRHLAERWGLSELAPLASFGQWQRHYPDLVCGKKRGFAYYSQTQGNSFTDDELHSNSLLVAASSDDARSDTHWLRSDVDHWLFQQAVNSGTTGLERTSIRNATFDPVANMWQCTLASGDNQETQIQFRWLIDATGGSPRLRAWTGVQSNSDWMRTRTGAIFGHFRGVEDFAIQTPSYHEDLQNLFCGDDSAQHHVFENGWLWALRFCNGITSLGFVLPETSWPTTLKTEERSAHWQALVARYPSIERMLRSSEIVAPESGLGFMRRLSRCSNSAIGKGWISLPNAYGFVDPLHSSGIAHSLSGVARIAEAFGGDERCTLNLLNAYAEDVHEELSWIDTFVALCYQGLPSFKNFAALASYYFVSAIGFEQDVALDPIHWPRGYMLAKDSSLRSRAESMFKTVSENDMGSKQLVEKIQSSIAPWNRVGLLDPSQKNRLAHTTAPKQVV